MEDKFLMENLMFGSKVMNDLYMHGFIESANEKVYVAFTKALQDTAKMHYEIFNAMESAGFYTMQNVEESKVKQTKQKLENSIEKCCKKEA